jgi:hypothetical protein
MRLMNNCVIQTKGEQEWHREKQPGSLKGSFNSCCWRSKKREGEAAKMKRLARGEGQ